MKNKITMEDLESKIVEVEYVVHTTKAGQIVRWCVLTMENGFAVSGEPSCAVDPVNDDEVMGKRIARENAVKVLWALEGYSLKTAMRNDKFAYTN